MTVAHDILNSDSIKPNKKITFAGKEYLLNEETGQLDPIEKTKITTSFNAHHEGEKNNSEEVQQ